MASSYEFPNCQAPGTPPPHTTQPSYTRYRSRRSTLRSAEEQLRDIKEGDTSWQGIRTALLHEPPNSYASNYSNKGNVFEGENYAKTESAVRVYLHKVRKTDTLPLILFAYDISANALRKANRLWATDSIQSRQKLYLPVEECAVQLVPCTQPTNSERLPIKTDALQPDGQKNARDSDVEWPRSSEQDLQPEYNGSDEISDEWVMIPGVGPVQVISLPAHKLSYFPTQESNTMERSASSPAFETLVAEDRATRDSMDSFASRSSIGSLVEDGLGRIVRFWHENQGRKKWAKIGKDIIEL